MDLTGHPTVGITLGRCRRVQRGVNALGKARFANLILALSFMNTGNPVWKVERTCVGTLGKLWATLKCAVDVATLLRNPSALLSRRDQLVHDLDSISRIQTVGPWTSGPTRSTPLRLVQSVLNNDRTSKYCQAD